MSAALEIVRFEVPPERRAELLDGHLAARRAIAACSPPGSLWSRLAELDGNRWVEAVAWEDRAVFEGALERSPNDPVAGTWFALAEPGYTIVVGELERPDPPPPREGALELTWAPGPDAAPPQAADAAWSAVAWFDGRTLVDERGWVEGEPSAVRVAVHSGDPGPGAARIADAVDAAEERAAAA